MGRDIVDIRGIVEFAEDFQDAMGEWQETVYADRDAGLELTDRLAEIAESLGRLTRGVALSARGVNLVLLGDLAEGEKSLYEAMLLQKENRPEKAATLRHLAYLRAVQHSFSEAEVALEMAKEIDDPFQRQDDIGRIV